MAVERGIEQRVARLVRSQNGAVRHDQLIAAGLSAGAIRVRIHRRQLQPRHRGVYIAGDPSLMPFAAHSAALLSVGARAVISHRTAAVIWALTSVDGPLIEVTVRGSCARPRAGLRIHRARTLDPRDLTSRDNLRITAPGRTLVDFAIDAPAAELESALADARARRLLTDAKLEGALTRAPANHAGAARIRVLLETTGGRAMTRSQRERLMLRLLEQAQLPRPLVNVRLHGLEVDFYWPAYRLVVEFDGYATHGTRAAFERDRKRDQILVSHAISAMRVTDRQLLDEPMAVVTRIGQAIAVQALTAATSAAAGNVIVPSGRS